jgi:hypothetical protein
MGSNRLINSIFRFQSYPMIKMNQARRVLGNWAESYRSGTPQERVDSARMAGRFFFGNAMQGAITTGLIALAYGGKSGFKIKMEEAQDEPLKFLMESFIASMSGPMYIVYRGAKSNGLAGIGEQAMRMAFPYAMMNDMIDMSNGAGQYKDIDDWSKLGKFIEQKTPGTQAIRTGMAMFGLGSPSQPLDQAVKGFGRWKVDMFGYQSHDSHLKEDDRENFRTNVKSAMKAMRDGDSEKFYESWMNAVGEKGMESLSESLRSRKVLTGPSGRKLTPEELTSLEKRIGKDAYARLQYYDIMLEQAADGVLLSPPD